MADSVTLDQFMQGCLSGLVLAGVDAVKVDGAGSRLFLTYQWWALSATAMGVDIRFHLSLDMTTGGCLMAETALVRAEHQGYLHREGEFWRIGLSKDDAEVFLDTLPLSNEVWVDAVGWLKNTNLDEEM